MGEVLIAVRCFMLRSTRLQTTCKVMTWLLVLGVLAGCAGMQVPEPPPDANAVVKLPSVAEGLAISTTDLTTDGRFAKVRGRVTNTRSEEVDGIRYLVRVETRGAEPRTLDRFEFDRTDRLAPGGETMMRIDVESMYFGASSQLSIIALPKKLGGRPVAVPEDWQ